MMKPLPNQTKGVVSKLRVHTHTHKLQIKFFRLSLDHVASAVASACLILN